jgi:steroid 5-alpha reductase family enzyme
MSDSDGSPFADKPAATYIGVSLIALAIAHATAYPFGINTLVWVSFTLNWIAFVPAAMLQDEKFFDLVGAICNASLSLYSLYSSSDPKALRRVLCSVLVLVWAVRLGSFLFLRIQKDGKDSRFDKIKKNPARFFNVWTMQSLWCWFNLFCVGILSSPSMDHFASLPLGVIDFVGIAVWALGFTIEVISDTQKSAFKAAPKNKGKFIDTGVW